MTDLMPFNPALVTIERKRFSTTQGETLISYNGQRIEQYGDNPRLIDGEYHQQPDEYWIEVAKRDAIDRFMCAPDGDFYATVRHGDIDVNVCRTDFTYPRITFLVRVAETCRRIGADFTAKIAEAKAEYIHDTLSLLATMEKDARIKAEAEAAYSDAEAEAHGLTDYPIGVADAETPLHNLALAFMATRTDLALMSLDEWLDEHHDKLSRKERAAGRAICDLFFGE